MTLLLSLPLIVLSLLAQEPARSAPEAKSEGVVQRLRVIVEDGAGKRVSDARIFFVSSELATLDPQKDPEQLEFCTDKRGRAIIPLDPRHDWASWAVKSKGKKRWASEVQTRVLEKGILRLKLLPFPVPFIRISNLAEWKALYPKKLSLVYISQSLPLPRFRQELPKGKGEVRALPPLPSANYFPVLWHEDRGFLDTVYLSPAFHEGEADAEVLYERDYPLKKCIFGKPLLLRGKVKGPDGKGVGGAKLLCGPSNRIPCMLRQIVTTDEEGRYELVVPFKPESRRTSYFSDVVVWAPGSPPVQHSIESLGKSFQVKLSEEGKKASSIFQRDFAIVLGRALEWKCSGLEEDDALFLLTRVLHGNNPGVQIGMRIQVDDGGRLLMPSVSQLVGKKQSSRNLVVFRVYLRRGGRVFALGSLGKATGAKGRILDLAALGSLDLHVSSVSGRPLKRGYCQVKRVFSGSLAEVPTCFGLEPDATTSLSLPVGKYVMRFSQKPLGEGYASFEIKSGETSKIDVRVEPYLRLRGKIICEDEEVKIGGLPIQVYPQQLQKDRVPVLARTWAQQSLQQSATLSRDDGSFELLISPFIQKISLQTYASVANRYLSSQVMIDPRETKEVELPLR